MTRTGMNIVIAVAFIVLASYIFIDSLQFPDAKSEGLPGPSAFPQMIATAMFLASIILLVKSLIKNQKEKSDFTKNIDLKKTLLFVLGLIIYFFIFNPIGFIISSFLFITFLVLLMRGWSKKLIIISSTFSLGTVFFIYFVFAKFFKIALPIGIFGF